MKKKLKVLDIFSGIGGFSLGLKRTSGFETVCYIEIEPYCQEILKARMLDGSLDLAPTWDDIRKFDGRPWRGKADLVCGGFPCQDISILGKGVGLSGEKSGLWREMERVIGEVRPRFVLVENVPALTFRGGTRVITGLTRLGYDTEWTVIPAAAVGAPHLRERIWILAYSMSQLSYLGRRKYMGKENKNETTSGDDSDIDCFLSQWRTIFAEGRQDESGEKQLSRFPFPSLRTTVSIARVYRADHGISARMDARRNQALGNAIIPQIVEWIGNRILENNS